jgi:hypothetical protein
MLPIKLEETKKIFRLSRLKSPKYISSILFFNLFYLFFFVKLERQVADYKIKLDELRRAKATTVVKLEKEYVNTSIPGFVYFYFHYPYLSKYFFIE